MAKSMGINQAKGIGGMLKAGHEVLDGVDEAVLRNIDAVLQLSKISSSSLGPNGMNKLVINHLEKIIVTSDCATIVKELEVVHPAAKMVALAAEQQETEMGDATNLVVSLAGELLKGAQDLLRTGLHQAEIVAGYKTAHERVKALLPTLVCKTLPLADLRSADALAAAIKPVIQAKQAGYEDHLAPIVAKACLAAMSPPDKPGAPSLSVDSVRVAKIRGSNVGASEVMRGMVLLREAQTALTCVKDAKVSVFGCGIEQGQTETKGTVLIRNADDLKNYNKSEEKHLEGLIKAVAETGTKLVVAGGSISEMALHFIQKYDMMAIKTPSKWELRRICGAVGATAMVRLGAGTPEEIGFVSNAEMREVGGRKVVVLEQTGTEDSSRIATIVLRASTESVLNDLERAVDDGVNLVKTLLAQPQLVPGAGATEVELARQLQDMGAKTTGLDQYSITKFGEALEFVPKQLASSAGFDSTKVLAALYAAHAKGDTKTGVDLESGEAKDLTGAGILDALATKENAINLAVEAALTVLRVDQIIMSKQAGGPKGPPGGAPDG